LLSDRASRVFIGLDHIPLPALLVHNPKILNSYGGVEPLARVNTHPIALDARLALLLILATISNLQALLEIKVSPHFACAYWSQNVLGTQQWEPIKINSFG
jgi:hypothetical protein